MRPPRIRVPLALIRGRKGQSEPWQDGNGTPRKRSWEKLRRADELAAAGASGEEIAADLQVSPATLYNWRRQYGGMDTDAAKELEELREQNARLERLLADAELEKDALREIAKGKF